MLGLRGLSPYGVQDTQGVDQRGAGVHGHGNTEGFGDLFFGGARFQRGVGMDDDAASQWVVTVTASEMSWRVFSSSLPVLELAALRVM